MGLIYAEIELINREDIVLARRFMIGEEEIKKYKINMLVDTGSVYMYQRNNTSSITTACS